MSVVLNVLQSVYSLLEMTDGIGALVRNHEPCQIRRTRLHIWNYVHILPSSLQIRNSLPIKTELVLENVRCGRAPMALSRRP